MFVSVLKNKKDATEKEKIMAEKMASSYDISDIKYIEPVICSENRFWYFTVEMLPRHIICLPAILLWMIFIYMSSIW